MPTYDFKCNKCEKRFTVTISISQKNQAKCPYCSSSDLQQIFDNYSFFFGGKGGCQSPPRSGFS